MFFAAPCCMQLRDHPLMQYRGIPNWPPLWIETRPRTYRKLKGEFGILHYVSSPSRASNRCNLVIEDDGKTYVGTLIFNNAELCNTITDLLRKHVNQPIKAIGDLDLSSVIE